MSRRKLPSQGYTLAELMVVIFIIAVVGATFASAFRTSLFGYLDLQTDATSLTGLNTESNRIANVLRTTTDVTVANASEFKGYAYFFPADTYVSEIRYYLQTSGGITKVMADVTTMTSNPPVGTPITSSKKTYTIIPNYYQTSSVPLFTYLSASGNALTMPISDFDAVKGIRVSLAAKSTKGSGNQIVNVQVTLRNKKTNS